MQIEFDLAKDAANLEMHRFSLSEAVEFDFATSVVVIDDRFDYGEVRFRAYSYNGDQGRCLVFTAINLSTIRVISYRRARKKEMKRYGL